VPDFSFTADAVFVRRRNQHHRVRDHYGSEYDQYVVLTERVGPYEEQTPVKFVLQDLVDRIARLESVTLRFGTFTADAYIWPFYILASSVILRTESGSFTADATFARGFTADAGIQGGGVLTMDAWIV
jgi:hypothetical protein